MATLIIPDNTPQAELDKFARAMGKRLQCRATKDQQPQPEEVPHGHNRSTSVHQPALRVVDSQSHR